MSINQRLKEVRAKLGLTQAEFAEKAGVGTSTQKNYEAGKRQPDAAYFERMAHLIDVAYVITGQHQVVSETRGKYQKAPTPKQAIALDDSVSKHAGRVVEEMLEVFVIPPASRYALHGLVYTMLMTGQVKTADDMVAKWQELGWPER